MTLWILLHQHGTTISSAACTNEPIVVVVEK